MIENTENTEIKSQVKVHTQVDEKGMRPHKTSYCAAAKQNAALINKKMNMKWIGKFHRSVKKIKNKRQTFETKIQAEIMIKRKPSH